MLYCIEFVGVKNKILSTTAYMKNIIYNQHVSAHDDLILSKDHAGLLIANWTYC